MSVDAGVMKPTTESATGFMVGDNTVLTSLHTFSDLPAVWPSALVRVYDGKDFFKVKMISANPSADLALLVIAEVEGGVKFTKKPIRFADYVDKKKMPGHFYTFAFSTVGKDVYFPIKLGGYLMETNLIGNEVFPEPFGVVGGNVEKGFSGAPLIGSDGKVYGVVNRGSGAYVYVSTLEQIGSFLKESAERFNEGMAQKLLEKEKK